MAVTAIIIFLIALFNGALLNKEKDLVEVPYLEGSMYTEDFAEKHRDFNVRLQPQQYSDAYKEGQIMHQEPAGGSKVQKKTDLWITVSMGKEPETKLMENVVGFTWEQVEKLLGGQGYEVRIRNEASYMNGEGEVIRTDPAADTELTAGQTIKLWVSTGPDIIEERMPNVIGMTIEDAEEVLDQIGFKNIKINEVHSDKPVDQVVHQSVQKNTKLDVTKEIILEVSKGPEETEPPETDAAVNGGEQGETKPSLTADFAFALPERDAVCRLSIYRVEGDERIPIIEDEEIAPGTSSYYLKLTGSGTQTYEVYIDGELYKTQSMEFTE